ncbi:MAG: CapA family protein [Myxococcales bacterium]|nr:CapA family protein [Myxococcales bacterium]
MRFFRAAIGLGFGLALATACQGAPTREISLVVEVVDENGVPQTVALDDGARTVITNEHGKASLAVAQPTVIVASGEGVLAEPFVVGWGDDGTTLRVQVWSNLSGTRWSLHATGDVMFGRRYNFPPEGEPLIPTSDIAGGSLDVIAAIRRMYVAASVRATNLETVVSNLPAGNIYPGKRFILNSLPETLAALAALEVDAVSLANNHARDYLDEGVLETVQHLDAAGLPWFGGSYDASLGDAPLYVETAGITIGFLAWTTVDGDFVNDSYPTDKAETPTNLDPDEAWQYDARSWGYAGKTFTAATAPRRIGSAWRLFRDAEATMSEVDVAASWASLMAVYPELQDWVARRGHGGATGWSDARLQKITETKAVADVVVAQFHAGFQFQPAPSSAVRRNAHAAIDAGADIVICHHPHVLQGAEWYKDKLIIYSLGNFIFDQDFLSTYSSGILRTVWDGGELLQARFLPSEIVGYKPRPVSDLAARTTIRRLAEMSLMSAESERGDDGGIRVWRADPLPGTAQASLEFVRNSAIIGKSLPTPTTRQVSLNPGTTVALPRQGLRLARLLAANVDVGRELFHWGHFEDEFADALETWGAHWALTAGRKFVELNGEAVAGFGYLRLYRNSRSSAVVTARPVARVPLYQHRLYENSNDQAVPLDPDATYTMRAVARRSGSGEPAFRLDLYLFDDTNPTEDPTSEAIGQRTLEVDIPGDGEWHQVEVEVPPSTFVAGNKYANMVMLYVTLGVPDIGESRFDIDEMTLVEWRPADAMPALYGVYDYVRNRGGTKVEVDISELP